MRKLEITDGERKILMDLEKKKAALQASAERMMQAAQRAESDLMNEGSLIWKNLAVKYGLDLDNEAWALTQNKPELVLVQQKFRPTKE